MTRRSSESTDGVRRLNDSKLEPPESLVKLVARPQLIEMLDRCCDGRVTLISAPAGYGKTTLVSQWIDADPSRPVAWLSLDRLDNDLERFVRYVAAALTRVEADPEERVRAFSASERLVTDYLMEEVLARQPPEIREFLAITSVLERFSPELCDALLAGVDPGSAGQGRALLERLYHQNLFLLTLGPAHGWYRYHHLFRQLLLERFGELTTAVSKAGILHRAGDWFCANGWTEDGLTCFLAAGDLDAAQDVIGRHLHDVIVRDLSRRTLARWLGMFPPGAERERLPLLVASGYIKMLQSDYEGVEHLVDTIGALFRNAPGERLQRWRSQFQNDLECFRAAASFWNGDLERAREHSSRVLDRGSVLPDHLRTLLIMYYGVSSALAGRWAEYLRFVEGGTMGSGAAHEPQRLPFLVAQTWVHLYRTESPAE
jgi:LuxR family maltose regulon positive regulatory protein